MTGRNVRLALSSSLLVAMFITGTTGLIADALDLNRFVYHKYPAYLTLVLASIHVYLNRRALVSFLQVVASRWPLLRIEADAQLVDQARMWMPISISMQRGFARRTRGEPSRARRSHLGLGRRELVIGALSLASGALWGRLSAAWRGLGDVDDPGETYHQLSKPGYLQVVSTIMNWGIRPPTFKSYPDAKKIPLPMEQRPRGLSLEEAIERRRSWREYKGGPVSLADLSRILYYSAGITDPGQEYRAAPSAGALYPIEIYPVVNKVQGLAAGIYHYAVRDHALELVKEGDFRSELVRHAVGQEMVWDAQVVLILTAVFQRTRWKYGERAYRYILLEAGHIGQNVYLAAGSAGLGACAIGAFFDDDLNHLLGLDGREEAAVYMLTVGRV